MSNLAVIESVETALAHCRKKAVAVGDELFNYLLDMAILQTRKINLDVRGHRCFKPNVRQD